MGRGVAPFSRNRMRFNKDFGVTNLLPKQLPAEVSVAVAGLEGVEFPQLLLAPRLGLTNISNPTNPALTVAVRALNLESFGIKPSVLVTLYLFFFFISTLFLKCR